MSAIVNRTILKNASANLVRLAGGGVLALLLPPVLVRELSTDAYSAWSLLLQWTLYVGFLDLGVQTAVARFIAHADELHDVEQQNGVASTALAILTVASLVALSAAAIGAWQLPRVFPAMPRSLQAQAQIALLWMAGSFALSLPLSVLYAVFIGLQRNHIPAAITLLNRFTMAGLVILAALRGWGLTDMGIGVAVANFVSYFAALLAWSKWASHIRISPLRATRHHVLQIAGYCASVSAWMIGMLMVSGLDLTIVGIFDYSATPYYAVSATLTNFVAQAQNAVFAALLPVSAVLAARHHRQELGALLLTSTRYGVLIVLLISLPLMLAARHLLAVWVGIAYASRSLRLFEVLLVANMIRLCALPYATLLLGTGEQKKVVLSPLAEGVTNVATSIAGAYFFGAMGVAFGTLVGAFVGLGLHLFYNLPRTTLIPIDRTLLFRQGLIRPAVCALPLVVVIILRNAGPPVYSSGVQSISILCTAAAATILLFWRFGLVPQERETLTQALKMS